MIWNAAIANEADVPDATVIEKVIDRMLLAVPSNRQNLYDTDMLGGVPYICAYVCIYDLCIHDCSGVVRSSFMDWVLQVPRILDSLSTYSWLFSCPAHCSGNFLSSFVAGIGIGLCLGLLTGFWVLLSLQRLGFGLGLVAPQHEGLQHPRHPPSSSTPAYPSSDLPSPGIPEKRRSRVAGYLVHE